MVKNFTKAFIGAAAVAALPSEAQAGTTTATANVTMQVGSLCTVTGANIHLGSFKTTDTWGTVAAKHGYTLTNAYTSGTAGQESLRYGSVTCDAGLPWVLTIKGTNTASPYVGTIKITLNGKVAVFYPGIKRVGGVTQADNGPPNYSFPGTGVQVWVADLFGTGTGAAQDLLGNVTLTYTGFTGATITSTTPMGNVGSASDALTYTLTF